MWKKTGLFHQGKAGLFHQESRVKLLISFTFETWRNAGRSTLLMLGLHNYMSTNSYLDELDIYFFKFSVKGIVRN